MSTREESIRTAVSEALGEDPGALSFRAVGGGCINTASTFDVDGRTLFAKWNDHPLPRQFEAEAAGLRALADADSGLVIPAPVAFSDEPGRAFLVIEYLERGARKPGFDDDLGRGLAALHRATSDRGFGFPLDGYCGATPQPNPWTQSWTEFYADHRLGHQLRLARERGMSRDDGAIVERAIERARELLDDDEAPALIHGDLWSGNLHVAPDGTPSLIDPAAYYAHREAELGMMLLFGGFSARVYDAYDEAWPLRAGWRDRTDLYSLYHVLNHYNLFGGSYGGQAVSLARSICQP
jgi:fructosamine-3-kinase